MDALSKFFDDIHLNKSAISKHKMNGLLKHKINLLLYRFNRFCIYSNKCFRKNKAGDIILIPSGKAHHATERLQVNL